MPTLSIQDDDDLVPDPTPLDDEPDADEAIELRPISFLDKDPNSEEVMYDFRPKPEIEDAMVPKDFNARVSAVSPESKTSTETESLASAAANA